MRKKTTRSIPGTILTLILVLPITGCPAVTPDNPAPLTVSIFCPSADQTTGQSITITATTNRTSATTSFDTVGDVTTSNEDNTLTVTAQSAGDVTITVTARQGDESATDSCTITYRDNDQPVPLAIDIACPVGITTIDETAQISASTNDPVAIITFESTDGELNDNQDATASLTSAQPAPITVTATATLDDQSATASCTINFELPTNTREPVPASSVVRPPFASSCAQSVVNCTTSFPVAIIEIAPDQTQTVTETDEGFILEGSSNSGAETVNLVGANSRFGNTATELFHNWSVDATDDNPCSLAPGIEFAADANVSVLLATGTHYIRLTVRNDLVSAEEASGLPACGVVPEDFKSDFREVAIEVRDAPANNENPTPQ